MFQPDTSEKVTIAELTAGTVIWMFCILSLYSSLSPRFLPAEKEIIALISVLPLLSVLLSGRVTGQFRYLVVWFAVQLVFLVGLISQESISGTRILSSFVTLSGLLLIPFLFSSTTHLFQARRFKLLIVFSALSALLAPVFPDLEDFGRYDPPNNLLIGLAVTLLCAMAGRKYLIFRFAFFALVLFVAIESQWRFFAIGMVLLSVMCLALRRPLIILFIGLIGLFSLMLLPTLNSSDLYSVLRDISPRYASIVTLRGLLVEFGVRFTEVQDAAAHMQTYGSVWTTFFGFGHGAEFFANSTIDLFQNVPASSWKWRFGENNAAYVIHFGPIRLFFRYGLLGVGLGTVLIWIVLLETVHIFYKRSLSSWDEIIHATVCLSTLLYILQFFLQPVEHFPLFWISMGAVLFSPLRRRRQAAARGTDQPVTPQAA